MKFTNNYLNFRRVKTSLYMDLLSNAWKITISAEVLGGVLLLFFVSIGIGKMESNLYSIIYPGIIIVIGLIVTSLSFSELYTEKSYFYLTIPSSSLEKLVSKFIIVSILYLVSINFLFIIVSIGASGLNAFLFDRHFPIFYPLNPDILMAELNYLISLNIFLFGAVYFKKYNFLKTILAISIPILASLFFTALVYKLINFEFHEADLLSLKPGYIIAPPSIDYLVDSIQEIVKIITLIFYIFVTPFFLILTLLRLRESEA